MDTNNKEYLLWRKWITHLLILLLIFFYIMFLRMQM